MTVPEDEITPSAARTLPLESQRVRLSTTAANASDEKPLTSSQTPSQQASKQKLSALVPLTEDLSKAVTCPICLEYMEKARQLQCGHFFCAECVVRMLAMPKVRCAVCKEKTGKRMVRSAPLPFKDIVTQLRILEGIIENCNIGKTGEVKLNDGYGAVITSTLARIQESKRKQEEVRKEKSISPASRVCALCPVGTDPTTFGDDVSFGMLRREAGDKSTLFAHENCALFSEGVYEVDGRFENIQRVLSNTKNKTCAGKKCAKRNANVKCMYKGCGKVYHYPCAVVDKCVLVEDGYRGFCDEHRERAPVINQADFEKNLTDPRGEMSLFHDEVCYLCRSGGRLLMCDTCERVTHPACSGLRAIPLGEWSCGVCTGGHKAPLKGKEATAVHIAKGSAKRRRAESANDGKAAKRRRTDKRYILSHTGLQDHQRELLRGVTKMRKTVVKDEFDGRVTHLIIRSYTPSETPARTMKLCRAIAARVPLVCYKWVEDSCETEGWVAVDPHIHPLSWSEEKGVFEGKRFCFGCFGGDRVKKEELSQLVQLGGGCVVGREPSRGATDGLIYVRDEDGRKNGRRELLARFEPPPGATVVASTWILDQCTKNRGKVEKEE